MSRVDCKAYRKNRLGGGHATAISYFSLSGKPANDPENRIPDSVFRSEVSKSPDAVTIEAVYEGIVSRLICTIGRNFIVRSVTITVSRRVSRRYVLVNDSLRTWIPVLGNAARLICGTRWITVAAFAANTIADTRFRS